VDCLFTNPPFGHNITVDDPAILEQFDLAHVWDNDKTTDTWAMRQPKTLTKRQPPEILFIERCVQFLKPGTGIASIVLPDAILGAPGLAYVREWILTHTRVLASIDLHPDAFQPGNSTQTSLLVIQRKSQQHMDLERAAKKKQDHSVFLALANHVGHDKRGHSTYVRDEDGNDVLVSRKERVREVHEGMLTVRDVETQERVPDDNTEQIALVFREWLNQQ
jgi:type I restriction enzyme M protein